MGLELTPPGHHDVHVWIGRPTEAGLSYTALAAVLSPDESRRATRFRWRSDREVFVTAHGLLRVLLGHYLRQSPAEIAINKTSTGKPEVAPASGVQDLQFSLSHARNALMLGFARDMPVGVDIENVEREVDIESLQDRVLCTEEREYLDALADADRQLQFYRYWTKKEAYLKARGIGLAGDMRSFRFVPEGTSSLQSVIGDGDAGESWTVSQVNAGQGMVAAVAMACSEPKIVRRSIGDVV